MIARRSLIAFSIAATLVAAPRLAVASADYPGIVQQDWQLPHTPDCTICHQSDLGGENTATKFFARSLKREGLIEKNDGSLDQALAALKAQNTDSDGDGISDIDELQMGSDPNDGPGPLEEFPTPMTGCAIGGTSRQSDPEASTGTLALAVATLAVRKRRRRPRSGRG